MWSSFQGSTLHVLLRDPLERIFSFFPSLSAIPRDLIQHSDFLMTTAPPARRRGIGYAQPSPARRQGWTVPAGGGRWPGTWLSPYCSYFTSHRYVVYSPTKKGCRVG